MGYVAPLSEGFGYGIVLGLGAAFAGGMILTTWALKRYKSEVQTSEMFSTAGRTVKTGLVASAVVSSWTWWVSQVEFCCFTGMFADPLVLQGCYSAAEFRNCVSIWCFGSVLVCVWCYGSDSAVRYIGH